MVMVCTLVLSPMLSPGAEREFQGQHYEEHRAGNPSQAPCWNTGPAIAVSGSSGLSRHHTRFSADCSLVIVFPLLYAFFLREVAQNWSDAARKRAGHFCFLSDEEVAWMEQAVQFGYEGDAAG